MLPNTEIKILIKVWFPNYPMADAAANPYLPQLEEFLEKRCKGELDRLAGQFPRKKSLDVDYRKLDEYDADLADELIERPESIIDAARKAVASLGMLTNQGVELAPNIRFYNLPPEGKLLVRDISSGHINRLVSLDGVINKITEVRPRLTRAAYECRHCGRVYHIIQTEEKRIEPTVCACQRKDFQLIKEQSVFIDNQKAQVQEPLERLRGGEQAERLDLILTDDLTQQLAAGDKIALTAIVRIRPPKYQGTVYEMFLEAVHVEKIEREFEEIEITEADRKAINELAKDPKIYEKIVRSISPSIYGHDEIKEAIALQLFSGTPGKSLPDGAKIRSDFHILLIGDPGTAKTRLLQYVKTLAPKGLYVSGKSATGGGLTAIAEKDESFGEGGWTMKAGALVLAAGGMAMIDEFDKMSDEDRSAMHEAMESGTISVAKAGIVTQFKANASILAAANPKMGRFDPNALPAQQFNIPVTILSRFDLIFPMRDEVDASRDREIARHILVAHQTSGMRVSGRVDGGVLEAEKRIKPVIEQGMLRKYVAYARKNIKPVLSDEAMGRIESFYSELRELGKGQGTIAITPRYLEALVRLAEASAKGRINDTVELEDAERSIRLMRFCLKGVGMDPETGRFDIDIIATGQSKSRVDRARTIMRIVSKLNAQNGEATHDAILEEAKLEGIDPRHLDETLAQLKRDGDIYEPRYGFYKPAPGND